MKESSSAFSASVVLAVVTLLSPVVPMLISTQACAQTDPSQDRCQRGLVSSSRVYLERVVIARLRCQNRQFHRNVPPVDCLFGGGDDKLQRALENDTAKLDRRLQVACSGANLAYLGFPGACTDTTGGEFDTADLEQCVVAQTRLVINSLLASYVPETSQDLHRPESSCIRGTAKDAFGMFRFDLRTRENCMLDKVADKLGDDVNCRALILPYGPGTKDERVDRRVRRAYVHLLNGIPNVCTRVSLETLRYNEVCDNTGGVLSVIDVKNCLFDLNTDEVLNALAIPFPTGPVCGNGRVEGDEQCDNGSSNSDTAKDACRTDCKTAHCGDGVTDTGEECDGGAGCLPTCKLETCGDGIQQTGEQCDDGNTSNTDACVGPTCQNAKCGDTYVRTGIEQCDDGNTLNTDACVGPTCQNAVCGDSYVHDGVEQCDNGLDNSNSEPNACRTDCKNAHCGDGTVDTGETCDDGNSVNGDACDSNCTPPSCGNGVVSPGEDCDGTTGCTGGDICMYDCTCGQPCPGYGELTLYSGTGETCSTNPDCPVGTCDLGLGRCRTVTQLDSGWTGLSHNSDIDNFIITRGFLDCASKGPLCGVCEVAGVDPSTGACRCSNDTRQICDKPFEADATNCGGAVCDCYFGSPFPLSSAGTPACIVNRFFEDVTGTADVDAGTGHITANLRTQVFLGITTTNPCPTCGGTCSSDSSPCVSDVDCAAGTCQLDPVMNDGVRGGVCIEGRNAGLSCDVTGLSTSFPARPNLPGGGGYSMDCLPDIGKNVSGSGLRILLDQTTGVTQMAANVPCGNGDEMCPCRQCTTDGTMPCTSDSDCSSQPGKCSVINQLGLTCSTDANCKGIDAGTCNIPVNQTKGRCTKASGKNCTSNTDCNPADLSPCIPSTCNGNGAGGFPSPNDCDEHQCTDVGGGEGECTTGPDTTYCDAVVTAPGSGILSCNTNGDCTAEVVGVDAGNCTLVERRKCFSNPIVATGQPSTTTPVGAAVFCVPPTSSGAINNVAGLPGPARAITQVGSKLFCAGDPAKRYTAGVGGCID